ncbi:HD domain-containing protein [Sulfurimonas sp. SAG-AH-194-I05]|nr:HD domain-containing phosphohydrolase [Sulfurimonas sp. SAG-AH-194-I05]MDF1875279.1 HD domain-containing protein [Sulfurimonas sp. SAG-AH-194-I05]
MLTANEQINVLLDFGTLISKEKNLDNILIIMADYAKLLLEADRCSIFLADNETGELYSKVAHGTDEIRFPMSKGIAGFTVLSKEIQIVVDAYNDFRFNKEVDSETGYHTTTIVTVPLINHDDEVIGVFQALNKVNGELFSTTDAQTLLLVSNYAASAIENTYLYQSIKESQEKLILKLSTAAEFKDNETSEHTKRVGLYAQLIAKHYGMRKEDIELILITAPMHDAGKIGIPDTILLKPGRLDADEIVVMKTHSTIGYELLDDSNTMLKTAGLIAKEHHEKYDGSGYPEGLKGKDINIFARITAIADVFDALTSVRPYKKAWTFDASMNFLQEQKGSHFDPELIDIFMKHSDDVKRIYTQHKD